MFQVILLGHRILKRLLVFENAPPYSGGNFFDSWPVLKEFDYYISAAS